MFGIYDLLSESINRKEYCCCWHCTLIAKKLILVSLITIASMFAIVLEYVLIRAFEMPIHDAGTFVSGIIELIALILLIYGIFVEKEAYLIPYLIVESIRICSYIAYSIYYCVNEALNAENTKIADHDYYKIVGHLFVEILIHIFLILIAWRCYRIIHLRSSSTIRFSSSLSKTTSTINQPINRSDHYIISADLIYEQRNMSSVRDRTQF